MQPIIYHVKDYIERLSGLHFNSSRSFPWLRARRRFLGLHLDLQNKCNLRCRMCYFSLDEVFHAPRIEMSDALIDRMEREIWPVTAELWLTIATEPLLSRKLDDVLQRARRAGIPSIHLVTNALALNAAKSLALIEGKLDWLHVSIDGATRETYEAIRVHSDFETVVGNIRRLQALKAEFGVSRPRLTVTAVMMRRNLDEWARIVELAADLKAEHVSFMPLVVYDRVGTEDRLWDEPERVNEALRQAAAAAQLRGIELVAPAPFPRVEENSIEPICPPQAPRCAECYMPWNQMMLYPDGRMAPCPYLMPHLDFGNLAEKSFRDIFYGPVMRQLRQGMRTGRYHPVCRQCSTPRVKQLREDLPPLLERKIG